MLIFTNYSFTFQLSKSCLSQREQLTLQAKDFKSKKFVHSCDRRDLPPSLKVLFSPLSLNTTQQVAHAIYLISRWLKQVRQILPLPRQCLPGPTPAYQILQEFIQKALHWLFPLLLANHSLSHNWTHHKQVSVTSFQLVSSLST